MGWKVDTDIESLKGGLDTLNLIINRLDTLNDDMGTVVQNMSDVWEGDAAISFINVLKNDYEDVKDSKDILISFRDAVEAHCKDLEEKDNFFEKLFYQISGYWNSWFS